MMTEERLDNALKQQTIEMIKASVRPITARWLEDHNRAVFKKLPPIVISLKKYSDELSTAIYALYAMTDDMDREMEKVETWVVAQLARIRNDV